MLSDKSVNNHAKHTGPREWLFWAAIALAVGEFIDAFFFVEVPAPGIIYAIMVAALPAFLVAAARVGLRVRQRPYYGRLGMAGFAVAFIGTALILLSKVSRMLVAGEDNFFVY